MDAPTNAYDADCSGEGWPEGVRGVRLLERPRGTRLVSAVWELDPGAAAPHYHLHHATEELLVVLRGTATLRTPDGERTLPEGEVAHFPRGAAGAHQVLNRSGQTLRYLMVAAHSTLDVVEYVDEGTAVVYSHAASFLGERGLHFEHSVRGSTGTGGGE
ncbi:MAG TPA: cupin domain-containing protein [Gaiellaceae bacterium]|nr:cupin domain-containing protein [Gaiellaceae bacterium]